MAEAKKPPPAHVDKGQREASSPEDALQVNGCRSEMGNPSTGIYVYGVVQDREIRCLVDTGAGRNLLSMEQFRKLSSESHPSLEPADVVLMSATGMRMKVHGQVTLPVQLGRSECHIQFIVADCAEEAILGVPFLQESKAKLDFSRLRLHLFGHTVPCFDAEAKPLSAAVRLSKAVTIAPGQEYVVPGRAKFRGPANQYSVLAPTQGFTRRHMVLVAHVLMEAKSGNPWVPVRIFNPGTEPVSMAKRTLVAYLQPIEGILPAKSIENRSTTMLLQEKIRGLAREDALRIGRY